MKYIEDLQSNSSPRIRKATQNILKENIGEYCPYLLDALVKEMQKPKAWKTQCQLIHTIGVAECTTALPTLKKLVNKEYQSTVLYKELGFAIFILENTSKLNLDFFYHSVRKGNVLQISGVCSGILFKKIIPPKEDIRRIIAGVSKLTKNEGQIITPRCYIASVSYLWPNKETISFLESCKTSTWSGLVEIADNALQGNPRGQVFDL